MDLPVDPMALMAPMGLMADPMVDPMKDLMVDQVTIMVAPTILMMDPMAVSMVLMVDPLA